MKILKLVQEMRILYLARIWLRFHCQIAVVSRAFAKSMSERGDDSLYSSQSSACL